MLTHTQVHAWNTFFRQVGAKKDVIAARLWWGQAVSLDEAYEFFDMFSLCGERTSAINSHASTLNTLVQQGRTKRATRTSTSFGEGVRTKTISLSVLGNCHPSRVVPMERQLIGNHDQATKERFLFVADEAVARHDKLPPGISAASGRWSWIPLTALQAKVFGWEDMLGNPTYFKQRAAAAVADDDFEAGDPQDSVETEGPASGYPVSFPDGVPSRIRYVRRHVGQGLLT